MGRYGNVGVTCPNCGSIKTSELFHNDLLKSYCLVCQGCGLILYAEERKWIPTKSMIQKDIIEKSEEEVEEILDSIYWQSGKIEGFEDNKIITEPF